MDGEYRSIKRGDDIRLAGIEVEDSVETQARFPANPTGHKPLSNRHVQICQSQFSKIYDLI